MMFTSCHENINHKLQMADECLDRNSVDSAYNILKQINPENLDGDENIVIVSANRYHCITRIGTIISL